MMFSLGSVVTLFCAVGFAAASGEPVPFKTLDRGDQSNIEDARQVVVRTPAEWTALWKLHAADQPPPAVDLTQSMIVGVFLGSRPTGGYGVEIASIEREGDNLTVTYRERRPAKTDIVTQVITMPYQLVTVGRSAGTVRFTRAR
jgi:hypothetical protein